VNRRSPVLRRTGLRFDGTQQLHLEGDFDRTFTLYCPRGYERDALYIFTPDLMALVLDVATDAEIELIGDQLVLYSRRPWRLWRPANFAALIDLAGVLGARARRRTDLYQDERASVGVVAPGGVRLRAHLSAGALLSVAASCALGVYGVISLLG
jgi:hypothetical protein